MRGVLAAALILLGPLPALASPEASPGRPGDPHLLAGCLPAYATMDSEDGSTQWYFEVRRLSHRTFQLRSYTFSNRPCCEQARQVVLDVLQLVPDNGIEVQPCR